MQYMLRACGKCSVSVGPSCSLSSFYHHHHHAYSRLGQFLGIQQAHEKATSWIWILSTKKLPLTIFSPREARTNCPGASCKLSLKNCQSMPQWPQYLAGFLGARIGDYAVGLCQPWQVDLDLDGVGWIERILGVKRPSPCPPTSL